MKIAYVLITNGLEYDDRIRKEMFSMREILGNVEFKVFAFHGDNRAEKGVLSYGVPYEIVSLRHRGGRKGFIDQLRKEYDFYSQIKPKVKDFDIIWCCDHQPFFFPLFSDKLVIWDLHEIPASLIGNRMKNYIFHIMERRCKWLIHANNERLDYLIRQGVITQPEKSLVLRNFPDKSWLNESESFSDKYLEFKKWLNGSEYIYLQGINSAGRYPLETLSAIMKCKSLKTVVIGNVPSEVKKKIEIEYPDVIDWIFYTGQIVQSETAAFIAHCKFSIVLYRATRPNNRYCEPNRMFQSMAFGKPVIVGCNEPMANVVNQYKNGIVLSTDGGNNEDIVDGIRKMLENYDGLWASAMNAKGSFSWECQHPIFEALFS